jgi:hypothetical protein
MNMFSGCPQCYWEGNEFFAFFHPCDRHMDSEEIHLLQEEYETAACWSTVPDTQLTDDVGAITCPACQMAVLEERIATV